MWYAPLPSETLRRPKQRRVTAATVMRDLKDKSLIDGNQRKNPNDPRVSFIIPDGVSCSAFVQRKFKFAALCCGSFQSLSGLKDGQKASCDSQFLGQCSNKLASYYQTEMICAANMQHQLLGLLLEQRLQCNGLVVLARMQHTVSTLAKMHVVPANAHVHVFLVEHEASTGCD